MHDAKVYTGFRLSFAKTSKNITKRTELHSDLRLKLNGMECFESVNTIARNLRVCERARDINDALATIRRSRAKLKHWDEGFLFPMIYRCKYSASGEHFNYRYS